MAVNTFIGLGYQFDNRIGLGISYAALNFRDGAIHSQQVLLTLDVSLDFNYEPYTSLSQYITDTDQLVLIDNTPNGGYNNISFLFNNTFLSCTSKTKSGDQLTRSQQCIGAEVGHYFNNNTFAFIQTEAMLRGRSIGYLNTRGGLIIFPQLFLEALLTSHVTASISDGYIIAPGGNF